MTESRIQLKIKRLRAGAREPTFSFTDSVGIDLYAHITGSTGSTHKWQIPAHSTRAIPTGWAIELPEGYFTMVCSRSGLARDRTLFVTNAPGIIDNDYRGEIWVLIHNAGFLTEFIEHGDRIAQMIVLPYPKVFMREVDDLTPTERGGQGFGSTGR